MARIRFKGLPLGSAVSLAVDQGGNTDTWSTAAWGNPAVDILVPENTVPPAAPTASNIGETFGIGPGTWINPVTSYEYRLVIGGVLQTGVTSFPTPVQAAWDGATPVLGVRAIGPGGTSAWVDVTGPQVRYANPPAFSVQPTFSAGSYVANATVTINLGTAGPGATLSVDAFTLNGVDKTGELTGTGVTRTLDSTGEPAGTLSYRTRSANSAGPTLSNTITASLGAVGGAFFPNAVAIVGESSRVTVENLMALGTADSLTVSAPSAGRIIKRNDGKFTIDLSEYIAIEDTVLTATYTAVKAGNSDITGTLTINAKKALQQMGWANGEHYYFPVDGQDSFIVEPGENFRKLYVSPDSLFTKSYIQANHPVGNANAAFLLNTPVPVGMGGNGVLKYGETEALALHVNNATSSENTGETLWKELTNYTKPRTNSHLYLKRGFTYTMAVGIGGARGESPLHPHVVRAYGAGSAPILSKSISLSSGFGRNYVFQDLATNTTVDLAQCSNVAVDGMVVSPGPNQMTTHNAGGFISTGLTVRRVNIQRISKTNPSNGVSWSEKSDREQSIYPPGYGVLIEKYYNDIAGWAPGYLNPAVTTVYPIGTPQPPQSYSHCIYAPTGKAEAADPDADSAQDNSDLTLREVFASRGSLTGIQFRPGGFIYNTLLFRCNLGMLFGGGNRLNAFSDTDQGPHSLGYRVLVTQGGQKTGINAFSKNKGINTNAPDTSLVKCMVAHLGPANDGIDAWGSANQDDAAITASYESRVTSRDRNSQNGSFRYLDAKVWDWTTASPDEGVGAFTPTQLANACVEKFAEVKWGLVSPTYKDFIERCNIDPKPWDLAIEVIDFFEEQLGILPAARGTAATVRFAPQGRVKEPFPGTRWDGVEDWSTGDLPGTNAGDTADLDGHKVRMFDNATIATLTLKGGTLVKYGGRLTTTTISDGGTIELSRSGQVHMSGYAGGTVLSVTATGGRWRNAGAIASNFNLSATNEAEIIFAAGGGAACTIASGRTLELVGGRGRFGFDGTSGTAALTLAGTTKIRPLIALGFYGRNLATSADGLVIGADFKIGSIIRGETSGFTAKVVAEESFPSAYISAPEGASSASGSRGLVYLETMVGTPLQNERLIGDSMTGLSQGPTDFPIAFVSTQAPVVTFPRIREFRSGFHGEAMPAVASTVTLGGTLDLHLGGVPIGNYVLVQVDTVSSTFASRIGYIPPDRNAALTITGTTVTLNVTAGTGVIS